MSKDYNPADPIVITDEMLSNWGKRDYMDKKCLISDDYPKCSSCGRREHFVRWEDGKEPICITEHV